MQLHASAIQLRILKHAAHHHHRHHHQILPATCGTPPRWRLLSTVAAINNGIRATRDSVKLSGTTQFDKRKLKKRDLAVKERSGKYRPTENVGRRSRHADQYPESMRRRAVALEATAARWKGKHETPRVGQRTGITIRHEDEPSTRPAAAPRSRSSMQQDPPATKLSKLNDGPEDRSASFRPQHDRKPSDDEDGMPISVPYNTAASIFLYGLNVVRAALRARRRKMYALHLQHNKFHLPDVQEIRSLARRAAVKINDNASAALLSQMSDDRPHNGVILEVSRIPAPPVLTLARPNTEAGTIAFTCTPQSLEDRDVNIFHDAGTELPMLKSASQRQPLIVMLDGILDPQNVGNILRTAHFYGVEAVAVATNTCADINSGVVAKASSGACEAMRIIALPKPSDFVYGAARNGWKIWASVGPGAQIPHSMKHLHHTTSSISFSRPLATDPCILMLGAEGEGLRKNLLRRADGFVSIMPGLRASNVPNVGVDSVNVGVAVGVLLEAFMRQSRDSNTPKRH